MLRALRAIPFSTKCGATPKSAHTDANGFISAGVRGETNTMKLHLIGCMPLEWDEVGSYKFWSLEIRFNEGTELLRGFS